MATTVREATYQLLRELGLTTIFGNPGSTEEPFLQDFPADFQYILGLQEASVVAMADGYAQATGHPALVNLHTAAGIGNAMASLNCAHANKTPLIVTAGQQTREMLLLEPYLSNPEATRMPRSSVKWSYEPVRAGDVPAAFMRAHATATQPSSGPVFLSLPMDDWDKPADGTAVVRSSSHRVAPDPERLEVFARRIGEARSPVLVIGASVDRVDGWEAGRRLAEHLNVPVWAPPETERAAFPEDHALFQGYLPFAIAPLSAVLEGHDLVVVIGAPVFRYYPHVPGEYLPAGADLLHISDDSAELARAPVGDGLLADPLFAMDALLASVTPGRYPAVPARVVDAAGSATTDGKLAPTDVFATLQQVRPADAVFLLESTSNMAEFHKRVPITRPRSLTLFGSGGLGWALPAAVGYALGERDTGRNRPVVAVLGDGASNYSIQALYTAAQHKLPVIFLVLRNGEYGILKAFAREQETPDVPGLDLPGIDFVKLAEGYGCKATRVNGPDDLSEAFERAFRSSGPTLLEIAITSDVAPLF